MCRTIRLMWLLVSLLVAAPDAVGQLQTFEPIPWFEDNDMKTADRRELLRALDSWQPSTFILTTRIMYAPDVFAWLVGSLPNDVQVIPAFKTFDRLPSDRYADAEGWKRIAVDAAQLAEITGSTIVLLDNELALNDYHRGQATIDLAELPASLEPLAETGLLIVWYQPELLDNDSRFPDRLEQTTRLVETVARAVPRSIFSMGYKAWPNWWENDRNEVGRRLATIALVGADHVQDRLFANADGVYGNKRCHTIAEAHVLAPSLIGPVFYYPGRRNWVTAGRAYRAEATWRELREGG